MKVVRTETIDWVSPVAFSRPEDPKRSPGWHMKAILQAMGEEVGILESWERPASGWESRAGMEETWQAPLMPLLGLAVEAFFMPALAPNGKCPGECYMDFDCGERVFFTPDWVTKVNDWPGLEGKLVRVIDECKATWRSARKGILDWWMPPTQCKSYGMALNTYRARIFVYYVNGMYEKSVVGTPVGKRYWIEFDDNDFKMQEGLINSWLSERVELRTALRSREVRVGGVGAAVAVRKAGK